MEIKKNPKVEVYEEDEEDIDVQPELVFDIEDIPVQVVDGVAIDRNIEEVKLLFYYFKPGKNPKGEDSVRCKAVAELRCCPSKFQAIIRDMNQKAKDLKIYQEKLPIYS